MQFMLAITRLTRRQPPVIAPPKPPGDTILARMAREFDRESGGPMIEGIDANLTIAALTNDLKDPKTREAAKRQLVKLAEADISAGRPVNPLVEQKLGQLGIQII